MLKQLQKRNQSGFTIIEVMIVLAIAGVIMMLVFLAIPSLQRNNRNTQYRNDVANVLGLVSEYTSNRNGALPVYVSVEDNGDISMGPNTGSTGATKVGTIRGGTTVSTASHSTTFPNNATSSNIVLMTGTTCDGDAPIAGGNRSIVALFEIETSGGVLDQCQAS